MRSREVEIVHGAGDVEIGVGVEAIDEGRALVAEIALDLEVGVEAEAQRIAVLQGAAELALQRLLRKIGDVRGHAGHREAPRRRGLVQAIVAALPVRVGHDRLASDLVERDVLRRMAGGAGDRHGGEHPLGVARGPFQHLHPAHRPADDAEEIGNAEMVDQRRLRTDHVADGHDREAQVPGLAGPGIGVERARRAQASAQHVAADDEVACRVQDLARADDALPPAGLAGDGIAVGDELVARQRMADQDGVRLLRVQLAIGLVGHPVRSEIDAAVEAQRPVGPQDRVAALGERLALGIGQVVQHYPLPRRSQRKSPRPEGRGLFRALRPFSDV